ncbi:UNVERIFIED_CONTAM: hypothetical protein Cloal_1682 [Acetivibrio alkalicellulosi]
MHIDKCWKQGENDTSLEFMHESVMNMHMHWLNPLLFKRKSKYYFHYNKTLRIHMREIEWLSQTKDLTTFFSLGTK